MGKALDSFINSDSLKTLDKRRKRRLLFYLGIAFKNNNCYYIAIGGITNERICCY